MDDVWTFHEILSPKVDYGDLLLKYSQYSKILQVGEDCPYVQGGYKQARLFVKGDKIEIEGPGGVYTKKNWDWESDYICNYIFYSLVLCKWK